MMLMGIDIHARIMYTLNMPKFTYDVQWTMTAKVTVEAENELAAAKQMVDNDIDLEDMDGAYLHNSFWSELAEDFTGAA
jgi:hypothetical protein